MACHDFIKQTEKEITFRQLTDLLSLSACNMGLGLAHLRLTTHFTQSVKFSAKDITLFGGAFWCLVINCNLAVRGLLTKASLREGGGYVIIRSATPLQKTDETIE